MKRLCYLLLFLLLAACQNQSAETPLVHNNDKNVENVDVTNRHGSIEGLERMADFYRAVQAGTASNLRIVQYTIEGAPIVTDLHYDKQTLNVTYDTTRDNFGVPAITTVTCGDLVEEINPTNMTYLAVDCTDPNVPLVDILQVSYDVSQQDFFEFVLEGEDMQTIDTRVDTQLTMAMKQEVYKQLVLANYLAEKHFTTSCQAEEVRKYYLQIFINESQRKYHFSSCDESADGVKFTALAASIVAQAANPQATLPQVIGYVLEVNGDELLIGEGLNLLSYEWMREELPHIDFTQHSGRFIVLQGVEAATFKEGDKIVATVKDVVTNTKPHRANIQKIQTIHLR